MEDGAVSSATAYDLSSLREEDFELHTTYIVPDLPVEPGTSNRAEGTLPRNLVLKASQALSDVSYLIKKYSNQKHVLKRQFLALKTTFKNQICLNLKNILLIL